MFGKSPDAVLSENDAVRMLGAHNVVTPAQAAKVWGFKAPDQHVIGYRRKTAEELAASNVQRLSDWRLVYIYGLSLKEQSGLQGRTLPFTFYPNDWWLKD